MGLCQWRQSCGVLRTFVGISPYRPPVWASSKLRRSTSVIATSFCLWSLCGGNKAGLNYLIISELSEAEMEKLEGLLRERSNPSGRGRMCALCGIKVPSIAFICRRAYKSESELFDRFPAP